MTPVIKLLPDSPDPESIRRAASVIRSGGLVAFPTETVYGLGADAMNEAAVARIFKAKGRPADNPLIVHVSSRPMLDRVATAVPESAARLIDRFWPGPLTLVLGRRPEVAPSVSAGLPTVAVRMPHGNIALSLISAADTPIAAPSANASGRPSPTLASHVEADLSGKIDLILDGGPTSIGVESTVVDMTSDPPVILRPGWITRTALSEVIGAVEVEATDKELRRSPGTRHRHYSPRARLILVEKGSEATIESLCKRGFESGPVGLIAHSPLMIDDLRLRCVMLEDSAEEYARGIYRAMRELDAWGAMTIVVEGISEDREGAAVMDRLRRAAAEIHR